MSRFFTFILILFTLTVSFSLRGEAVLADKLRAKARAGDVASQLQLADELMFGKNGRTAMPQLAVYWFRQAAMQNSPLGQYNLALCYLHGWGMEKKRPAAAYRFFEKAMYNGVIKAAVYYARMTEEGVAGSNEPDGEEFPEVKADPERAINVLRKVSVHDAEAEMLLAQMLAKNAFKYAAELLVLLRRHSGKKDANPEMLLLYAALLRSGSAGVCDPELAVKLLERAAAGKNPEAMAQLAEMLYAGVGITADPARADKLTEAALQAGSPRAIVNRGIEYMTGVRRAHDPHRAFALFSAAAEKNYPAAWRQMAFCHAVGIGTAPDERKAFDCYFHAARNGDPQAMFQLGEAYRLGKGVTPDLRAAGYWYIRGAEHGDINAMREAGLALWDGRGVKPDQQAAEIWLRRAALAGDRVAAEKLNITAPTLF